MLQYQSASALVNCIDLSPLNASIISALGSTTSILSRIGLFDWESSSSNSNNASNDTTAPPMKRMVHDRFTYLLLIQSGLSFLLAVAPAIINWLSQWLSNSNKQQEQQHSIEFKKRYQILYATMMTCLFSVHALILPLMRQMNEIVPQQYKAWLVRVQSYAPMLGSMMTTLFSLMTEMWITNHNNQSKAANGTNTATSTTTTTTTNAVPNKPVSQPTNSTASQAKKVAAATSIGNSTVKKVAPVNNTKPVASTTTSVPAKPTLSATPSNKPAEKLQQSKPTNSTIPPPPSSSSHQYATFYQSSFYMLSIWSACIALVTKLLK